MHRPILMTPDGKSYVSRTAGRGICSSWRGGGSAKDGRVAASNRGQFPGADPLRVSKSAKGGDRRDEHAIRSTSRSDEGGRRREFGRRNRSRKARDGISVRIRSISFSSPSLDRPWSDETDRYSSRIAGESRNRKRARSMASRMSAVGDSERRVSRPLTTTFVSITASGGLTVGVEPGFPPLRVGGLRSP